MKLPLHMRIVLEQVSHVGVALVFGRARSLSLLRGLGRGLAVV